MQSFLNQAANWIFNRHKINELQDIQVVLPSRRAVFFFKKELASLSEMPFFSPKIASIDDFLSKSSGLQTLDNVELYFEIFKILKSIDPDQSFEKFMTWVPTLLKDFENVDFSLVENPHLLFKYMSEAEAISRWELDQEYEFTYTAQSYFNFFDKISMVYEQLGKLLLDKGKCYRGLMYRHVAENIDLLIDSKINKFYFVGLNALSKAEEQIIEALVKSKRSECIWDSDDYYMETQNKAGKKLRSYKRSGKYGEWGFQNAYLTKSSKNINIFQVSNESLQAKLANDLAIKSQDESHVLVVLDEGQFLPLMLNIPSSGLAYNISIGLPIGNSAFAGIVEILVENFQSFSNNQISKLHYSQINKIINHKIIKILIINEIGFEKYTELSFKIAESKKVYFDKSWFYDNDVSSKVLNLFFERGQAEDCIEVILKIVELFFQIENPIIGDLEFVFANVLLQKLNIVKEKLLESIDFSLKSFKVLLKELLKNERVPFEGDSMTSLQIMSMLETRCLDFQNVTILSFNEGNLPSNKKSNSFIPYDAAKYFGLPLYSDQDAIMAYHFFRLMQRAENLNFIYLNSASEVFGNKEKSRFIRQVEEELVMHNPKINLHYPEIEFGKTEQKNKDEGIEIQKTNEIRSKIKDYLENKGLSATAISDYLTCSLRFYWKRIEKIQNDVVIDESMGSDVFGTIVHRVLEVLDEPYLNRTIDKSTLQRQKELIQVTLNQTLSNDHKLLEIKTGLNLILVSVASKILEKYFEKRLNEFKLPFSIIKTEGNYAAELEIEGFKLKLYGVIDKIESHANEVHIIDYKTGKVEAKEIVVKDNLFLETILDPKKEKLRQLFIYFYLFYKNPEKTEDLNPIDFSRLVLKIYSFKNLKENIVFNTNFQPIDIIFSVEEMLEEIVKNLMDIDLPFFQTDDKKACTYCDFVNICKRN